LWQALGADLEGCLILGFLEACFVGLFAGGKRFGIWFSSLARGAGNLVFLAGARKTFFTLKN
jgi:hypothetical protein